MSKFPQSWVESELKNVFDTSSGGTPKRGNPTYYGGNIPWLKSGELNNGIVTEAEEYITEEGLKNSSAKLFPRGSLLIALYGATVGKLGILDFDSTTNQAICCIYQNKYYDRDFLFYYLLFKKEYLVNQGKGGAQPNISQEIIKALNIPVPPLNEQKRIVEKIEEEFGKIDEGVEKLKLAQEQIKQYRQSVLKTAFNGKLYKTTEWGNVAIKDIADVGTGATPLKSNSKYYGGNIAWVTSGELNNNFVTTASDYITDLAVKETNVTVYPIHTLLIAMYGEGKTRGKCSELLIEAGTNQAIAAIQITNEKVNREYLKKYCLYNYNNIRLQSMGGVQPNLNLTKIKNILFPLPTLDEQKQIVKEIEKRFEVADEAEKVIAENLDKAEQLKQSILKIAFEGRLVPQDPTDEPASELLAKIKAERGT